MANRVTAKAPELAESLNAKPAQTLKEARESLEREMVQGRLAAAELGISRPELYELMEKMGIGCGS
jgi:DNA-binding NtrC family response regulator